LEVLHASRKAGPDGDMPDVLHSELSADVHFYLAEAFHSIHNNVAASAHYKKSLHLYQKSSRTKAERISAIKIDMSNLEGGADPELRCPSLARPGKTMYLLDGDESTVPAKNMNSRAFITKINSLMAERKYKLAESHLRNGLGTQRHPYKTIDAAVALNMLGSIYRIQEDYAKSARQFRQAMRAVLRCCGADNVEATKAYEGLRDIKEHLSDYDQRIAAIMFDDYFDRLKKVSKEANASDTVHAEKLHATEAARV